MNASIIIVTLNRPDCVQRCLACLEEQELAPEQVIVVDPSRDTRTREVVSNFPAVLYLRNENGFGRMTASRNIGLLHATGEIIAFIDDDAFPHPQWLARLVETYADESVGAVGGRARNNQPGEEFEGVDRIGRLTGSGELTGFFAADPGKTIEVDHIMGCNMSFRRNVLAALGGFREDYPGISGVREDTDMSLRVRKLGYRLLFNPAACVDHIGAPQAVGRRFDTRYSFYASQNHCVMLIRNFGAFSPMLWRYLIVSVWTFASDFMRKTLGAAVRLIANVAGTGVGVIRGTAAWVREGAAPARYGTAASNVSAALQTVSGGPNTHARCRAAAPVKPAIAEGAIPS